MNRTNVRVTYFVRVRPAVHIKLTVASGVEFAVRVRRRRRAIDRFVIVRRIDALIGHHCRRRPKGDFIGTARVKSRRRWRTAWGTATLRPTCAND